MAEPTPAPAPKPWWQSKLTWVGIGLLTAATLEFLAKDELTPEWLDKVLLAAAGILVIIFRSVTVAPVANRVLAWLLAASLFFASAAQAKPVAIIIDDEVPGATLVEVGADRSVAVNPIRVLRPTVQPSPVPIPVPVPQPSAFEAEVEKQARAAITAGGTLTTGAGFCEVYFMVAAGVADGSIDHTRSLEAVNMGTKFVLTKSADAAKRSGFEQSIRNSLQVLDAQGSFKTKGDYAAALTAVANGLSRATGYKPIGKALAAANWDLSSPQKIASARKANGILDGIDLVKLMEFIRFILELFKLFSPQ